MASGTTVEFVPARRPEAVRMDLSRYKVIQPREKHHKDALPPPGASSSTADASDDDDDEDDEDDDDFEVNGDEDSTGDSESLASSDSIEDSEKSDSEESDSSDEISAAAGRTGSTTSSPASQRDHRVSISSAADSGAKGNGGSSINSSPSSAFYDINELPSDQGTRSPRRIHKSWQPSARAPVGLENRGVTCYQNAAVQAILHLPAVGRYLLEVLGGKHPKVNSSSVTYDLAQLFKKMLDKRSAVFPSRLIRRLKDINPMLDEWQQEDSHEYYMSLISRLQEDSVPRGEKLRSSIIHDIFGGSVKQKVTCQRCHTVSTTTQDFYDLPVSFSPHERKDHFTLSQSIKDFFTQETIAPNGSAGSGYHCETCRRETKAVKQIAIEDAPEYLTVHIKRFKMDGHVSKKLKDTMSYPMEMDLTRFQSHPDTSLHYRLIAVIVHEGRTVSSGHYIALARQPGNEWMLYDDEMTKRVSESAVANHPSAYILLYSRLLEKPATKQNTTKLSDADAHVSPKRESKHRRSSSASGRPVLEHPLKTKKSKKKRNSEITSPHGKKSRAAMVKPRESSSVQVPMSPLKRSKLSTKPQAPSEAKNVPQNLPADSIDEIFGSKRLKTA